MAKDQKRGNREHKKPKQLKAKPAAAAVSSFSVMQPSSATYSPGKKK